MAKLRIVRRGRFWALLEDGRGLNAFETKREAFEEMDRLRRQRRTGAMKLCQPRPRLPSETGIEWRNELDRTLSRPKLV